MNGMAIKFKLDTGADVTVIGNSIYSRFFINTNLLRARKKLFGPSKSKLHCLSILQARLRLNGKWCGADVYVVENLETPLLGRSACLALDTVAKVGTVTQSADDMKERFPNVFSGLGCMDGEYETKLTPSHEPFNQTTTPRRVPIPLLPKVKNELDRIETMGVIEKVDAPTEWCSHIVVVPKHNGKVRICGNFIQLNKAVLRKNHPMPTTEQTLGKLTGAKVISKLDATSGFWQRKVKDSCKQVWSPHQQHAFNLVKEKLSSAPTLAIFDPTLETTLSAHASSYGLGAVMTQKQKDGNWKPVVFISRALSATERRYAQIEKEARATTWACEKLADYLFGKRFHVETDHKPLVPILGSNNFRMGSPVLKRRSIYTFNMYLPLSQPQTHSSSE